MDHDEATRSLKHLLEREADRAQETITELETLALHLPEKPRQLAQSQMKASHKLAKEFRELALRSTEK
jgi:hypothetical protein